MNRKVLIGIIGASLAFAPVAQGASIFRWSAATALASIIPALGYAAYTNNIRFGLGCMLAASLTAAAFVSLEKMTAKKASKPASSTTRSWATRRSPSVNSSVNGWSKTGSEKENRESVDFFELVMGIPEAEFQKLSSSGKEKFIDRKNGVLINKVTKQRFAYGNFKTISIAELRQQTNKNKNKGKGTFSVIEGNNPHNSPVTRSKVDIGALQADPNNNNAVFQVASNFNGLEGDGNPAHGMMNYLDPALFVQGETAAISAAPGLIYRMYFVEHDNVHGQLNKQINLLDNFSDIAVKNGYVADIKNNFDKKEFDIYIQRVKVGFHENIQPILGLSKKKNEQPVDGRFSRWALAENPKQRISQVLTAAMNPYVHGNHENLSRILLHAAYEGTLKSAYVHGKKKVVLTLIGGGVFKNKLSWIGDAIEAAVKDFVEYSGMEIILVIYDKNSYESDEYKPFQDKMESLVKSTGGDYYRES